MGGASFPTVSLPALLSFSLSVQTVQALGPDPGAKVSLSWSSEPGMIGGGGGRRAGPWLTAKTKLLFRV